MKQLVAAVVLAGSAAVAEVQPFHANVGVSAQVFSSRGYDLVDADDHLHALRFAVGTTFSLRVLQLDLEAGVTTGGTDVWAHQRLSAGLALAGLDLSATARFPVLSWLHPYVRVGAGYDWATLTLTNGATRLGQTAGVVSGLAGAGVQFSVRMTRQHQRGVSLFFDVGAGGVLRPGVTFAALAPSAPVGPQADPLGQRGSVDVGTLPLSGLTDR
ncbi:MAG: hypothetical protein INH41_17840, partial [Myxococcaceae bacterium]|nr:hypothetical protein [Myxococcaceae bacterium]